MAVLPISRAVEVTVTRQDNFPTITGFGTPLIVTTETTGPLSQSVRTKVYGSMDEVAADWDDTEQAYIAAEAAFSQNPRPLQVKIGYRHKPESAPPTLGAELNAIVAADNDWYQLVFTNHIRGVTADEDAAINWVESRNKLLFLDSNEVGMEDAPNTTNVAARNKVAVHDRTMVIYNPVVAEYGSAAIAAYSATRNFDRPNSAYTAKFKKLRGLTTLNKGSAVVQAITGFVPALGADPTTGHMANVFVNIGGSPMLVEGNMLSGAFLDEIHASDWLIARIQEELLGILATNDRVPMTDPGVQILASGVEAVMNRAVSAGLIAEDFDDEGELEPAYEIKPTRVRNISQAQRRKRVAPPILATFRYSGAAHYASVAATMTF
jgi:hypothetical protein